MSFQILTCGSLPDYKARIVNFRCGFGRCGLSLRVKKSNSAPILPNTSSVRSLLTTPQPIIKTTDLIKLSGLI